MSLLNLSPEQIEAIRADLRALGVGGSALLAIPVLNSGNDSHEFIRSVLLGFLRSLFRSMPESQYRWDSEDRISKVIIQYADPRRSSETGSRPVVSLELSPFTYTQSAVNDLLGGFADGTTYHTALRNGAAIIRCRCSTKLEADSLAHLVMGAIKYMHAEIEKLSGFVFVDAYTANPSSGELQQDSTVGEAFVANVVANIHYQESWKRLPSGFITGVVVMDANPRGILLD